MKGTGEYKSNQMGEVIYNCGRERHGGRKDKRQRIFLGYNFKAIIVSLPVIIFG